MRARRGHSIDDAFEDLEDLQSGLDENDLLAIGHAGQTIVTLRTKRGLDADGKPFIAYSPDYAKEREAAGLSTSPDLARSGHMLGAMAPKVTGPEEVSVLFNNPLEAVKADTHNNGIDKDVYVRPHSRGTYVDKKTGRRVSAAEARRDRKRKNKRVTHRTENVTTHQRRMKEPKREFLDVRLPAERAIMEDEILERLMNKAP